MNKRKSEMNAARGLQKGISMSPLPYGGETGVALRQKSRLRQVEGSKLGNICGVRRVDGRGRRWGRRYKRDEADRYRITG